MTKNKKSGEVCKNCHEFKDQRFHSEIEQCVLNSSNGCEGVCWNGKSDHFGHIIDSRHPACKNMIKRKVVK